MEPSPRRVVGLGALAELGATGNDDPAQYSFAISEFVVLDDGDRVILHRERGFTCRIMFADEIWPTTTAESIRRDVLNCVLPDDAETSGEDHPWEWLANLARKHGIVVTADDLRLVRYEVELAPNVTRKLHEAHRSR